MLLFQQLLNLKTKPLDSAIDDWVTMTKKLKELARDAGDMSAYAKGTAWKGQNAGVTRQFVTKTAEEFQDAVSQAESITNLLKDTCHELTKAKAELVAIYETPPYGLKIDPYGVVVHLEVSGPGKGDAEALIARMEAVLQRAADADARCAGGLAALTKDAHQFSSVHYDSLKDAKTLKEQAAQTKLDVAEYVRPEKWGSGTIKPVAEFLSYRSWIGGGEALLRRDIDGAAQGAIGGLPAFAGGEASKYLEKGALLSDAKGMHHRPGMVNTVGKFGGKIFGAPVAIVATMVDYGYTPSDQKPGDSRVEAPAAPGKVRYR
ncbi:hypothetical protein ACFY8V_18400 [Streptomyces californicus]|uniref:hypothetical protein n=1 Tax=Streptomyces californicus TaxID=67351 RepID=UPI0036919CB6